MCRRSGPGQLEELAQTFRDGKWPGVLLYQKEVQGSPAWQEEVGEKTRDT